MVRTIIISLLLVFGAVTTLFGQTKDDRIESIRTKCRTIDIDTGYSVRTLRNEQFLEHMTDGGGELTGYFKNGQVRKIIESVGISYCMRNFEYYLWDGQLIFVYEREKDYPYIDSTGSLDYSRLELVFEGRYYFDNSKLVKTSIIGKKRIPDDKDTDIEKELLEAAKQNMDLLKRQSNNH